MGINDHKLWQLLKQKAETENESTAAAFLEAVHNICQYGIDLSKTIRDTFQTYTLHDEVHICNVMSLMLQLIDGQEETLTRDECAMLAMAACCHDIGMSVTEEEKAYLRSCPDCMQLYLDHHPGDFSAAYCNGLDESAVITDEILQHYVRTNHHTRIHEQFQGLEWPEILGRSISVNDLIAVCQSHGEDAQSLYTLQHLIPNLDLCLCSVLLRLGDILDFDATRAPDTLYRYINLAQLDGMEAEKSRLEWEKHQASRDFTLHSADHSLLYRAECSSIQVEQAIVDYLNWVDYELTSCGKLVRHMLPRWRTLILPNKVERMLTARGYLSGEYRLTLDQERVLDLLVGRELYSDPAVFVRELIQNAIDAVRTRQLMDKNLSPTWKPQINIRTWVDDHGCYWFRIEDNGIGMTQKTIQDYFLKVGHSYYSSDQFRADKLRSNTDPNYKPISRFGIGILSCFMGDSKNNRVEVTTKHFMENGVRHPAYRLSIQGINGYYYLADESQHRKTAPEMPNFPADGQSFIPEPGTIIAVRTNLYQSGGAQSFKDIIDKYVIYPEVPIHYEGIEGTCDYKTEQEFLDSVSALTPRSADGFYEPIARIPIAESDFQELKERYPKLVWEEDPNVAIYCLPLHYFTDSPLIKGATVIARAEGKAVWQSEGLSEEYTPKPNLYLYAHSRPIPFAFHVSLSLFEAANEALEERVLPIIDTQLQQSPIHLDSNMDPYDRRNAISMLSFPNLQGTSAEEVAAYQSTLNGYSCSLPLDLLERFPWFQTWFARYFKAEDYFGDGNVSVDAHNGILADVSQLLPFSTSLISHTILLLKDDYCPNLNLSRNQIQSLPLEAICRFHSLADQIENHLNHHPTFSSFRRHYSLYYRTRSIPTKEYWAILEHLPDLSSHLRFTTAEGKMTLLEIERYLQEHESLLLSDSLNRSFHLAVLLQKFDLKIAVFHRHGADIHLTKKDISHGQPDLSAFPPALFLPPFNGDITVLSALYPIGSAYRPYNAEHPCAKWLIQNQSVLQTSIPGLYQQIIEQLLQGDLSIEHINAVLQRLRQIPSLGIEITPDLSTEDFFIIPPED